MAVAARDIPVTRDMVAAWIEEARAGKKNKKAHIRQQLDALGLEDRNVDVKARSDIEGSQADIADIIEADLDSYA